MNEYTRAFCTTVGGNPVRFSKKILPSEKCISLATMRPLLRGDECSRFGAIPACNERIDRRTPGNDIYSAGTASCGKYRTSDGQISEALVMTLSGGSLKAASLAVVYVGAMGGRRARVAVGGGRQLMQVGGRSRQRRRSACQRAATTGHYRLTTLLQSLTRLHDLYHTRPTRQRCTAGSAPGTPYTTDSAE